MRVGIALGSNLGDRMANLDAAREAIVDLVRHRSATGRIRPTGETDSPRRAGAGPPFVASPIYETEPIDCEPGAGTFLNAVVEFEYEGEPIDLLEQLIRIEEALGRRRDHARHISRTIDIDLLYCGDLKVENERLQLPHPRLHLRKFVLAPLADVRPDLILPNQTKNVRELLAQLGDSSKLIRCKDQWYPIT
jgi:2-amino-4-hydroxy-6-hydroxymethyldihydropteridine diphosphokinase